jgi:hypothetical protein
MDRIVLFGGITRNRHGAALLGTPEQTSKVLASVAQALPASGTLPIVLHQLDWETYDEEAFFGKLGEDGKTYTDGEFTRTLREVNSDTANEHWIVISGPTEPVRVEMLNTCLDDNKCLCLPNNERISLGATTRIIFLTLNCEQSSPAFVSRVGVVLI